MLIDIVVSVSLTSLTLLAMSKKIYWNFVNLIFHVNFFLVNPSAFCSDNFWQFFICEINRMVTPNNLDCKFYLRTTPFSYIVFILPMVSLEQ